jgi:hypothetical protein
MRNTAHANYLKSHLLQSVAVMIAVAGSVGTAPAQTQTIATPPNVNVINLLNPFTTLLGTTTINQNLMNAVQINNNSTAAQRGQSIIDNTITTDNGVVLSDALGSKMSTIWNGVNSQASNGTTVTLSNNLLQLFRQINAVSQDDSGKAKNWLADGSANGSVFVNNNNLALGKTATSNTPITNVSPPANGTFNVYDKAYNPPAATRNLTGDSRPIQVLPNSIAAFSAPNYFDHLGLRGIPVAGLPGQWRAAAGRGGPGFRRGRGTALEQPDGFGPRRCRIGLPRDHLERPGNRPLRVVSGQPRQAKKRAPRDRRPLLDFHASSLPADAKV